ncbi:bifunctional nicotinamidase/pyrazinamidase [Mangrovicoccus algicola]|uniref:Nicotinamidase n=1 Tax=Mangrovicoccus algicola TaxID=2771008 RepID=A0A8J6YV19_9RHOB|nr:bifunctional nicotinamidase/pyrazinamidase [Mangrovicoccus algicola]MBE3638305.1 bifunctional nicotinamidase/pyrazinamidase [Mangrovicoccus algicola]
MRPETDALVAIDIQTDFCPGGALAVPGGDAVVGPANALMDDFATVVLSQDWHPAGHSSFATSHPGKTPFETVQMPYGTQVLWPDHCLQGSPGAAFHPGLRTDAAQMVVRKGFRPGIDSYSAFFENDQATPTGLHGYLRERGVSRVMLCGLATDFCVAFSALDAARLGYEVELSLAATRGIDIDGSVEAALQRMRGAGVRLV